MSAWLACTAALALSTLAMDTVEHPARPVSIDPDRSAAAFGVKLFWMHSIRGRFPGVSGQLQRAPDGRMVVDATVQVNRLEMGGSHLRHWTLSSAFFDAARYPEIRFVSDPLSPATVAAGGPLQGQLTLRGVTRTVRFMLEPPACLPLQPPGCPLHAHGDIQRSDFGMDAHRHALSDQVSLYLTLTPAFDTAR